MKTKLIIIGLAVTNLLSAQVITTNLYNPTTPVNVGITDGNPVGLTEQFAVGGLSGLVTNVQVHLNIAGGFNGDLYAYLAGPQGQLAILLNRVGVTAGSAFGYSDAGMNLTLDGMATSNIHDYGSTLGYSLSGTVWAADGRNVDPQTAGGTLYGAAITAGLNVFDNTMANGVWTLFIADMSPGGGTANLNSTSLTIMTVPEPQTWTVLGGGLAMLWLRRHRPTSFS